MRRLVFLVYGLVFASELLQASIVPLLPTFAREFTLSKVQTGAILSATTFAMLVVSIPIGVLADRIGARVLAVGAGTLAAVSALVQGFATEFWMLLAGRAGFGIAFGTIWTAGLALIASSTSKGRTTALGGTIAVGGMAHLVGPAFSGVLADAFALAVPFAAIAGVLVLVTALLARSEPERRPEPSEQRLAEAVRTARREPQVVSAIALIATLGIALPVANLLVPLQLAENGLSAGAIGAVFSAGALVWVLAGTLIARAGERVASLPVAAVGMLLLAGALVLPLASASTLALVVFLLLRSGVQAPLSAISSPLAEEGARLAGIGGGTAMGLANVSWASAAVVAPLAGGAVAQTLGARWAFAFVIVCCLTTAVWVLRAQRAVTEAKKLGVVAPAPGRGR